MVVCVAIYSCTTTLATYDFDLIKASFINWDCSAGDSRRVLHFALVGVGIGANRCQFITHWQVVSIYLISSLSFYRLAVIVLFHLFRGYALQLQLAMV